MGRGSERGRSHVAARRDQPGRAAPRPRHRRARAPAAHAAAARDGRGDAAATRRATATCSSASASRRRRSPGSGTAPATPTGRSRRCASSSRSCASASRGETVTFEGDFYTVKRFRLGVRLGERRPKIFVAALNEQMLRLGGRDRRRRAAQLPARVARAVVRRASARRRRRRDLRVRALRRDRPRPLRRPRPQGPPELRRGRRVREPVRARPASPTTSPTSGAKWAARERDAALAAIGDAWVDDIQIMGDAAHVRAKVEAYDQAGATPDRVRAAVGRRPPRDRQRDAASPRLSRRCSAAGELRLARAVLEERLRRRRGRRRCRTPRRTRRPRGRDPAASGRPSPSSITRLASPIATTAPCAEVRGPVQRVVLHLVARHDPIEDAERVRFVGPHLPAAPHELLGPRRTDQPGQALRAAGAGNDAEQDLGLADPRRVRRRRAGRR